MHGTLHHVELYVSDLQRSTDFWGWLLGELGYSVFQQWDEGISYKLDATYLVFVQVEPDHLHRPYHRKAAGLNHLAFHGKSRAYVDTLTEQLRARNVTILYEDKHPYASGPDYYAVFFEDPDRIKVEVVASD